MHAKPMHMHAWQATYISQNTCYNSCFDEHEPSMTMPPTSHLQNSMRIQAILMGISGRLDQDLFQDLHAQY